VINRYRGTRRTFLAAVFTAAAALVLTALPTATATASAGAPATGYVALGDSYAAGLGAGNEDPASGDCHRSTSAYPPLWAAGHSPGSFAFEACSGATTADVEHGQLAPLSAQTGLVSLTAGANDAGFSDVMTTCVLGSDQDCLDKVQSARSVIDDRLPDSLDRLYAQIADRAPNARVVVLGYPRLFDLKACPFGMSLAKRKAIDAAADDIDNVTARAAGRHRFTFADVDTAFAGHEVCSADPWLHDVNLLDVEESFHPTATGQARGYLPVFTSQALNAR
jgi:lysophospholipase L1-like esterase